MIDRHPLPWRLELDREISPERAGHIDGAFTIYNADNGVVMSGGTYSHDGDEELNMNQDNARWLVEKVNA